MTDAECNDAACAERLAALEETVETLQTRLAVATDRDIPLVKGSVRAMVDADIETIEELPAASRAFRGEIDDRAQRVGALKERVAALGDVGTEPSTKEQKYAAVLAFVANKHGSEGKVAVSPAEIRGCTGVSRRYAYDLVDAMADDIEGVRVRESTTVQTGSGTEQKQKALLVDCEQVHCDEVGVNQFTTGDTVKGVD